MSRVIKASQITGKYKIEARKSTKKDKSKQEAAAAEQNDLTKNKKKIIKEAEIQSEQLIKEAEAKAAAIISEAETEKEKLEAEQAELLQQLKTKAEAEAAQKLEEEINSVREDFLQTTAEFKAEVEKEKLIVKKNIVDLAVKIASIVIDVKLEDEPEIINNIISKMLNQLENNQSNIVVRINPQLLPYLEKDDFYQKIDQKNLEFTADSDLKKGDCVIESNLGGKEGSLAHKLDLIKKELLKEVESNA